MTASFGQPTADENLTPGWNVQGNGSAGSPGPDAPGYGQAGNPTTTVTTGQVSAGLPLPAGALNVGNEASGSQTAQILTNPGYADGTGPATRLLTAVIGGVTLTAPTMTTGVAATNPSASLAALVTNSIPADVTAVTIKNLAGTTVSTAVQTSGQYSVPPGGTIQATFSGGTWSWYV